MRSGLCIDSSIGQSPGPLPSNPLAISIWNTVSSVSLLEVVLRNMQHLAFANSKENAINHDYPTPLGWETL